MSSGRFKPVVLTEEAIRSVRPMSVWRRLRRWWTGSTIDGEALLREAKYGKNYIFFDRPISDEEIAAIRDAWERAYTLR